MLGLRVGTLFRVLAVVAASGAVAGGAAAQDMLPILPLPDMPPPKLAEASDAQAPAVPDPAQPAAAPVQPGAPKLTRAQLDQLVAPIALYPDPLLSQVLMASTYPVEIVEASRWLAVKGNHALTGDALVAAIKERHWDPSVMALVAIPRLVATMSQQLPWTQELGSAFLAQQSDVMDAVQRLRHQAMAAGNLKTGAECHCAVKTAGQTVSIQPAEPQIVYVPIYTATVYGPWPDAAYPPFAFPLPVGFVFGPGPQIGFGPGIELALFGPLWGWGSIDWPHRNIVVDPARFALAAPGHRAFAGGVWSHVEVHRGLAVADPAVTARLGAARMAAVTATARLAVVHRAAPGPRQVAIAARAGRITHSAMARPAFHPAPFGFRPGQVLPSPERVGMAGAGPMHFAAGGFAHGPFGDRRR